MKRLAFLAGCTLAFLLAGCANYRLGTGAAPGFATLFVAPVRVDASLPQAQAVYSAQLRDAFLRDGRVRLVGSPDEADAVLTVVLDRYQRDVATVRPDDTGLARRFDLIVTAHATLTDRRAGKDLFTNRPLEVRRGILTDGGQNQSEYQHQPILARELAAQALHAVLDTW